MTIFSLVDLDHLHLCHPLRRKDDYDVAMNMNYDYDYDVAMNMTYDYGVDSSLSWSKLTCNCRRSITRIMVPIMIICVEGKHIEGT